jgi:non-heme chloroperoxidase
MAHLDLKNAIHVGHSTGGGEVARYLGRHGESRVAKAALITSASASSSTSQNPERLQRRN